MIDKATQTLREFCLWRKKTARERHVRGAGKKSGKRYFTAISRFGLFLGREPMLADLSIDVWVQFRRWLGEQTHLSQKSRQDSLYRLGGIWRAAKKLGLAGNPPTARNRARAKAPPAWEQPEPAEQSVRWYYLTDYYPLRLRARSDATHRLNLCTLRSLGLFLGREPMLSDLTDRMLADFLAARAASGRAPSTVEREYDKICAIWRGACRRGLVKEWPSLPRPKAPDGIPKAWLRADLDKLFAGVAKAPGKIAGIPAGDWWLALHEVLWWSGERIGAIMALRWSDVDLETGWLIVPAVARKGRLRDKATQLPPQAVQALERIREPKRALLFPWPADPQCLWGRYKQLLKSLGMPSDAKSMFHRMRRSSASHYEAAGGNATALLDHSSRSVTQKYLDPRIVKPPQAADLLFTPGAAKGGAAHA